MKSFNGRILGRYKNFFVNTYIMPEKAKFRFLESSAVREGFKGPYEPEAVKSYGTAIYAFLKESADSNGIKKEKYDAQMRGLVKNFLNNQGYCDDARRREDCMVNSWLLHGFSLAAKRDRDFDLAECALNASLNLLGWLYVGDIENCCVL